MKKSSKEDLETIISKICTGDYDRADVKLMLFEIREYLDPKNALRDIANCIHSERDRGKAFAQINTHIDNFVNVAKNSGKLVVTQIYNSNDLFMELVTFLERNGFNFDVAAFLKQSCNIIRYVSEFLDGTEVAVKNKEVRDCHILYVIENNKQQKTLCFCFNLSSEIKGALQVPTNVTIAMPFF